MVAVPAQRWLIAATLVLPTAGWCVPPDAAVTADPPPPPSKEMLLYLAEFEDADGQWVDPLEVTREEDVAATESASSTSATAAEPTP